MFKRSNMYLGIYSIVITAAFAAIVLMGARSSGPVDFDTINVHRINVREPDGTLRMVISDKAEFPGWILKGKEYPHERPRAGMLFYNDEGTEQGGLIFSGHKKPDGEVSSGLSLTFDRYDQNQQLQLIGLDQGGDHYFAGMRVSDVPNWPFIDVIKAGKQAKGMTKSERKAFSTKFHATHPAGAPRYFAGKSLSGNSVVMLRDAQGDPRLILMVTPQGKASIEFLDAKGKVVRKLTAETLAKNASPGN